MRQSDLLVKAVMECLKARFQAADKAVPEFGLPGGFPVPLKMGVDEDKEGAEYVLFQVEELDEIVAGNRTYHAEVSVELYLSAHDRTADEARVMQAWLEERLREVDKAGLNALEEKVPYRHFYVIGAVRLEPGKGENPQEEMYMATWKMTVPVQF